jgi:hypothetical protein
MRKLKYVAAVCAALVAMPSLASAHYYYHPKVILLTKGTSGAAGAAAVGGFLGFVAVLAGYDLLRRTTCSGDFLALGGPGFTEKLPNGNVMTPQCRVKKVANVVRVRG